MSKKFIIIIIFILLIPISFANGGCIKVADGVFVQLSSSPLVPIVNKEASFLISFANNKKELINEEISGNISIVHNDKTILKKHFKVKDGILDLKHTFKKEGLYEIFLEFDYKNKTYTPEDFLIEVKEEKSDFKNSILFLVIGIVVGVISMKFVKNQK